MTDSPVAPTPVRKRIDVPREAMPELPPMARIAHFREVQLGFDAAKAQAEARRCLLCAKNPLCEIKGCPLHNRIRDWMRLTAEGKFMEAALLARTTNNMPDVSGRVCPQERLCEGACVLGVKHEPIAIGAVERFLGDYLATRRARGSTASNEAKRLVPTGRRVAIVGGGPAGLACAETLLRLGHAVEAFDRWPRLGGLLRYGIPGFKLSPAVVERKERELRRLGLVFHGDVSVGSSPSVTDLRERGFDAVFIGVGAPVDVALAIPDANLAGILPASPFLARANVARSELPRGWRRRLDVANRQIVVLGGGDTAMDCVRTAVRLGARTVTCVYRRDVANMPCSPKDRDLAMAEGVEMVYLAAPSCFVGQGGKVIAVECQRMRLGEPDASGRRAPVPLPGETLRVPADLVVLALGYENEATIPRATPGLRFDARFRIEIDPETGQTSIPGVFAGGDATAGADLVVTALAAGRRAAAGIHDWLSQS